MLKNLYTVIRKTGGYIPTVRVSNSDFLKGEFYGSDGKKVKYTSGPKEGQEKPIEEIVQTFEKITGIKERRYVTDDLNASDIGTLAVKEFFNGSDIENLKYIIFAHNFGDISAENKRSEFVPSLGARVKLNLGIEDPNVIAYDLPFGCPG